jgi:hypothetical protein
MKCNILSWSMRRLNCSDKRLMVRNLLCQRRVDIVCLQETKLELIYRNDVRLVLCGCLWGCWGYFVDVGQDGGY